MKNNQPKKSFFDFKEHWEDLSDNPYPHKKLCRHVIFEVSMCRLEYLRIFNLLKQNIVKNTLETLAYLEAESSWLLEKLSVLWDSYKIMPYPLRHRRKLKILMEKIENELDAIASLVDRIVDDEDILNELVEEGYIFWDDIAQFPFADSSYYIWKKN